MLLIVGTICFDTGTVQLLIEGAIDDEDRSRLIDYLASCRKIGLNNISLGYPGPNSAENRSAVEEISASAGASVDSASTDAGVDSCRSEPRPETDGRDLSMTNQFEFRRTGHPHKIGLEYFLKFPASAEVLGVINPTLGLVGRSMNLDERTLSRLQLCVYELAVNSIEHGTFETKNPTITLALSSNRTHITASYKDNANLFLINRHLPVDINRQIKSGKTRGLGIFIMNRLSQEFAYKRMGDWNVTSFKIERMTTASIQNSGRTDMSAFSIKLELCDLDNSIIIQPNGAIDSSTTQNMEEHFNSLIKDHKRYIIVDFSQVTFISSSGIGILLGTVSTLRERGGDLIFMKVPTQIREIFDILNITDYFVNINSVEELSAGIPAK